MAQSTPKAHQPARHKHRPPPEAVDTHTQRAGLQAVAVFEAIKGVAVLAAGFGVLTLLNKDAVEIAEHWVRKLHMNPEGHLSMVFLRAAGESYRRQLVGRRCRSTGILDCSLRRSLRPVERACLGRMVCFVVGLFVLTVGNLRSDRPSDTNQIWIVR